ncbi:MAG TPA: 2-C-methyl-D-erythritol 4-phosphate cytidylyltransferase [Acidimicrobiales bacterium]|nr:2-C-methyl-D-erythritol 4-phosphate cytidylyltransferase [Acidimicrobiales bacterium]
MSVWAIVVAAGSGSRFGGPKQFEELEGCRVVDWALAASRSVADGVVLVVPADYVDDQAPVADVVVAGGATRSDSVRAGLAAVPSDADVLIVHDAARPFAAPALFHAVVAAVRAGADGAVPGVPVADTIKRVAAGQVVATLDRDGLMAVQTPQAFAAEVLRRAHAGRGEGTDDATLVEAAGGRVVVVPGDPANAKITLRSDLG